MNGKLIFSLLSLFLLAFTITGCGGAKNEISSPAGASLSASIGQEFTLPAGKTVSLTAEKLSIQFISVDADSRCAKGVMCIRAGEAKCTLQVVLKGSTSTLNIVDSAGIEGYSQADFAPYRLSFRLTPYPEAGRTIEPGDYKLLMTINK